ncbi:MAG TPA: glycosyl hydrolase-related protein, partial [Aggregatilineales bacterium]|nr:glycosyl hydrolase-related protein [Aggregatilineales bacterium]
RYLANMEQRVRIIEESARYLAAGALDDIRQSLGDSAQVKGDAWPTPEDVVYVSSPDFVLSTVKLPEDVERQGLIVRGWNRTDQDTWVTLTPWRAFGVVEVVSLDEVPSGGKLTPEDGGAVRFRAEPKHILTLWFHD